MKALLIVALILLVAAPVTAQETPTPAPGFVPMPTQEMYQAMATANANIQTAPDSLSAPNGVPVLPNEQGALVFAYIKWFISPGAAEAYAGPFAPIVFHLGLYVVMMFFMVTIYGLIWIGSYLFRWVVWFIGWLLRFVGLLLQIIGVLISNPIVLLIVVLLGGFAILIAVLGAIFGLDLSGLFQGGG